MARPSRKNEPIAVLDLGSAKIACLIAKMDDDGGMHVLGAGQARSNGLRSGQVVDMAALQTAVSETVSNAEKMAGVRVNEVIINVAGPTLLSRNMSSEIVIPNDQPVRMSDIRKVLEQGSQLQLHAAQAAHHGRGFSQSAGAMGNPSHHVTESEVVHRWSNGYMMDGNDDIADPRGMFGDRLGVRLHMVSISVSAMRNLATVINHCHLDIADKAATPHASALGCMSNLDREMGVTVVDMGAGLTTISVFHGNHPLYADCIPVGGNHVTTDISQGLNTPWEFAERLKIRHGTLTASPRDASEYLTVERVGDEDENDMGAEISRAELLRIIQPRLEETFELVRDRLISNNMLNAAGRNLLLTGGASQMMGLRELAGQMFHDKSIRFAQPPAVKGLPSPMTGPPFSTSVGLLRWAFQDHVELGFDQRDGRSYGDDDPDQAIGILDRVGHWLKELFG